MLGPAHALADLVAAAVAMPSDKVHCLLALLASYPLALPLTVYPRSPAYRGVVATAKHVYILAVAATLCRFCFSSWHEIMPLLVLALAVYAVVWAGVQRQWGKKSVYAVWALVLSSMAYSHLYRQLYDYGSYRIDITAPQMVMVLKLTAFAWNVYDGTLPQQALSADRRARAATVMPSVLEYLSFVFFFAGLLVGPAFEFVDFRLFISGDLFRDSKTGKIQRPSSLMSALKTFLTSVLFMASVVLLAERFAMSRLASPAYLAQSFPHRFVRLQLAGITARLQYYAIWKLSEGACILAGLGFHGYDSTTGQAQWDRVSNVNIFALEFAQNFKGVIDNWNMGTSNWLKHYVYLRLTPPNAKPTFGQVMSTYAISAFWHGFYPGYYLTFITGAVITETGKAVRKSLRPLALRNPVLHRVYNILGWIASQFILNYAVAPFLLLALRPSFFVWRANYFIGHIALAVMLVLANLLRPLSATAKSGKGRRHAPATSAIKNKATGEVDEGVDVTVGEAGVEVPDVSPKLKAG
ncbi:Lysophospholipid acyltransferase [Sorochytrium milnesiophthora]